MYIRPIIKTFKSSKQLINLMGNIKLLVVATLMIGIIIPIAANSESESENEFLPGVEGVNNITWGYPEGYYEDGYPVEGDK